MISLRAAALLAAVLAVAILAAIPAGRHEEAHARAAQQRKLAGMYALVGSVTSPRLGAVRLAPNFDCLLYKVGLNPYAIELCFDAEGRLIEGIDRRQEQAIHVASLRGDANATPVRKSPQAIVAFLHHYVLDNGAPLPIGASLPTGTSDGGPQLVRKKAA